jgi:hypothetical protein
MEKYGIIYKWHIINNVFYTDNTIKNVTIVKEN